MSPGPKGPAPRRSTALVVLGLAAAGIGYLLLADPLVPGASTRSAGGSRSPGTAHEPLPARPSGGPSDPRTPKPGVPPGVTSTVRADPLHPELLSVTDADGSASGWVVLDATGGRVHRLTPEGGPDLSFGRKGEGPGEFRDPAAVAADGDTTLVVERVGGRIHRFGPDGVFLGRRSVTVPGCFVPLVVDAGGTGSGPVLLVRCVDPGRSVHSVTEMAVLVPEEGVARILWASEPLSPTVSGRRLFAEPLLATDPGTVAVGRQSTGCVRLYPLVDGNPGPQETRCLRRRPPVPLAEDDRAFLRGYVRDLRKRSPLRFRPPRNHPALYDLFLVNGDPVALVATADDDAELVHMSATKPRRTVRVWGDGPVLLRAGQSLQYREELHGIRIRVAPFPPAG